MKKSELRQIIREEISNLREGKLSPERQELLNDDYYDEDEEQVYNADTLNPDNKKSMGGLIITLSKDSSGNSVLIMNPKFGKIASINKSNIDDVIKALSKVKSKL